MFRRILIALTAVSVAIGAYSQAQKTAMDRIRTAGQAIYKWGEGRSASEEEAREKAQGDLLSKLSTVVGFENILSEQEDAGSYNVSHVATVSTTYAGTLDNCETIIYRDEADGQWVCMRYVSVEDLNRSVEDRKATELDFIDLGREQEGKLNIADALKYYVWALRMISNYNDKDLRIEIDGRQRSAKDWLTNHITSMLGNIDVRLSENRIEYDESSYDKYIVNLDVTYAGNPVSALDLSYFNGEREVSPVHCKNGEVSLLFPDLTGFNTIDLKVLYDYVSEGKNYDPVLAAVYAGRRSALPFDTRSGVKIPVKIKKDKISEGKRETAEPLQASSAAEQVDMAPIVKEPRPTIERTFEQDAAGYVAAMQTVEKAIRAGDCTLARDCFIDEGYKIFELLMASGKVTVAKSGSDFTVERSDNFIVGKSLPVAVKNGKHISRENIVFRFDHDSGKIKSLAYALTERAENDIFREAQWSSASRYSLLQFMEDYQTAFALKRYDYIESIFSDDALIIVGSVKPGARKRFFESQDFPAPDKVTYKSFNKSDYMRKVKHDFRNKSFIQLVFEDTSISKVGGTEEFLDNEVLWIELKQQYTSSNYSDKGYLALQINMRRDGSLINVRTWTPYFVPLDELKQRFPIGSGN